MYISIDMDNLRVVHKHPDVGVMCALVHIELHTSHVRIEPVERAQFTTSLTHSEAEQLYRNTCGNDPRKVTPYQLTALLYEAVDSLPVSDVVPGEVLAQAELIPDHSEVAFKYVKGSKRPGNQPELFPMQTAPTACIDTSVARFRAARAAAPDKGLPSATLAAAPKTTAQPRTAAPSAPRGSGVRATIWEVADSLWNGAGNPTAKGEVLALRKQMMDVLEAEHGVKRTSSSNELGQWQKARVAVS